MASVAFIAIALCMSARSVRAEDELSMYWEAPKGCPDADWARSQVESRVGRVLRDVPRGVRAEVLLSAEGRRYVARMRTADASDALGERTFRGASCTEVADAATLVLSLTVSESAAERNEIAGTPALAAQSDDAEFAPFRRGRPGVRTPERPRPLALGLAALVDWGVRDMPAPGPALYAAYEYRWLRFGVSGLWLPAGAVDASPATDARAKVSLAVGRVGACARFARVRGLAFSGCAQGELGSEMAKGSRLLPGGGKAAALWAGAELGLRVGYVLARRFEVGLAAGALAMLHRPRFLVLGASGRSIVVQRSWPVSARIAAEFGVRF